jgi:hypothetical protein
MSSKAFAARTGAGICHLGGFLYVHFVVAGFLVSGVASVVVH